MTPMLNRKNKLERAPKISPSQQLTADVLGEERKKKELLTPSSKKEAPETKTSKSVTIRVDAATREKIHALINLGVGDSANDVIDLMIDEYTSTIFTPEQRKQLEIMLELYRTRKKR